MHRDVIDGVRVIWADLPGESRASLSFGSGARDEDIDQTGLSFFAKQLVLSSADTEFGSNSGLFDSFVTVSGTPEKVVARLASHCAVISEVPVERMPDVVEETDPLYRALELWTVAECSRDPWGSLLARRVGPAGVGLLRWPAFNPAFFSPEEVQTYFERYFTADNAVLVLTGPPPAGLRLPLPPGPRALTSVVPHSAPFGPRWYSDEVVAPGIAISAPPGPEALMFGELFGGRLTRKLERYDVSYWATPVDETRMELGIALQSGKKHNHEPADAARLLWQELRLLATEGPTQEGMAAITDGWPDHLEEATSAGLNEAEMFARNEDTFGLQTLAKWELFQISDHFTIADNVRARALSPSDVRIAVASWMNSAMVVVPPGIEPQLEGMTRLSCPVDSYTPTGDVLRPSRWRRLGRSGGEHLVLAADAIHLVADDGAVHTFPIADAMLVRADKKTMIGNVKHGCLVDISRFDGVDYISDRFPHRRQRFEPKDARDQWVDTSNFRYYLVDDDAG